MLMFVFFIFVFYSKDTATNVTMDVTMKIALIYYDAQQTAQQKKTVNIFGFP